MKEKLIDCKPVRRSSAVHAVDRHPLVVGRQRKGSGAGHTVVVGDRTFALHLLPSGILTPDVTPVIGNGVVVDPEVLLHELLDVAPLVQGDAVAPRPQ